MHLNISQELADTACILLKGPWVLTSRIRSRLNLVSYVHVYMCVCMYICIYVCTHTHI